MNEQPVYFEYTNYRGLCETREVLPIRIWFGKTDWHPESQWFLHGFDLRRREVRDFAVADIKNWRAQSA